MSVNVPRVLSPYPNGNTSTATYDPDGEAFGGAISPLLGESTKFLLNKEALLGEKVADFAGEGVSRFASAVSEQLGEEIGKPTRR